MKAQEILHNRLLPLFNTLSSFVFAIILFFLMIGILIGTGKLFLQIGGLLENGKITGSYLSIIADVLSLFILIQLFQHKLPPQEIYALSVLLFVLGMLRIASTLVHLKSQGSGFKEHMGHG